MSKEFELKEEIIFNNYYKASILKNSINNTTIYIGTNLKNDEKIVIKELINDEKREFKEEDWLNECAIMKKFECKNSVRLIDKFKLNDNYYIVMEYCDYNLNEFLGVLMKKKNLVISIEDIKEIMKQFNIILKKIINDKGVHRDIKAENIFVKIENNGQYTIKLGDYGFSKILSKNYFSSELGTRYYEAPEMKLRKDNEEKNFTNKIDLWSIGILIYYLCFIKFPIDEKYNFKNLYSTNNKELDDLISKLLVKNPKNRINWDDYFNHPFFWENDSSKNENNFILMNGKYKIIKKYKKYDVYKFYENLLNYW